MSLNNHKWMLGLAVLLTLSIVLSGCGKKQEASDGTPVIAKYEDGQVTQAEFDRFLNVQAFLNPQYATYYQDKQYQEQHMKDLIAQKILFQRAGTSAEEEKKAKDNYQKMKDNFTQAVGADEFNKRLKDNKITENDVTQFFVQLGAIEQYLRKQIKSEDLTKKYEASKEEYTEATVSHILIATEKRSKEEALKRANEVEQKLKQGGDFGKLAKEYSDDPGSKDQGGTYKDARVSQWVPEFKQAALTLPLNKISDPILTQFGYHIMRVEKRDVLPFDKVKTDLEQQAMGDFYTQFTQKDLPKLIKEINLPKTESKK